MSFANTEKPGIGEPSIALVVPAIAKEMVAATGKRVRKRPLLLEALRQA